MLNDVKTIIGLAVLRAKPQDLSASRGLLAAAVALDAGVNFAMNELDTALGQKFVTVGVQVLLLGAFAYGALQWRGFGNRFLQTATALFGTSIITSLVAWAALSPLGPEPQFTSTYARLVLVTLSFWTLAVMANILRYALEVSLAVAALLSFTYAMVGAVMLLTVVGGGT